MNFLFSIYEWKKLWKILINHAWSLADVKKKQQHRDVLNQEIYDDLICYVCKFHLSKMSSVNGLKYKRSKKLNNRCLDDNAFAKDKATISTACHNGDANHHVERKDKTDVITKSEKCLSLEAEQKLEGRPSKWQRRDSFSSCSSDSAVFCSLRHTQTESVAQDSIPNKEMNGKKRLRHSSGSSALSSASDSSNKDMALPVELLSCLGHHASCSKKVFPQTESKITTETKVSKQSTSCLPGTNRSEIETIVEEKTVSYTCEAISSSTNNESMHNLRRKIRKKTCKDCDCSGGSHTTFVVRRFTQIQRSTIAPKTLHQASNMLQPTQQQQQQHTAPEVVSCIEETQVTVNESLSSSLQDKTGKKRRNEMDKLYDALHEIKWAKHISPDNILGQIDFRRAATVSSYSTKKVHTQPSPSKTFKAPKTPQINTAKSPNLKTEIVHKSPYATRSQGPTSSASLKLRDRVPNNSRVNLKRPLKANSKRTNAERTVSGDIRLQDGSQMNNLHSSSNENGSMSVMPGQEIDQECCAESEMVMPLLTGNESLENDAIKSTPQNDSLEVTMINTSTITSCNDEMFYVMMPGSPSNDSSCDLLNTLEDDQSLDSGDVLVEEPDEILSKNICHTEQNDNISSTQTSSNEEVIFECLHPDIIEVETSSNLCCSETISTKIDSEVNCLVITPALPILTKFSPVSKHSIEDEPPCLEPCTSLIQNTKNSDDLPEIKCESEIKEDRVMLPASKMDHLSQNDRLTIVNLENKVENCDQVTIELMDHTDEVRPFERKVPTHRKSFKTYKTVSNLGITRKKLLRKYFSKANGRLKTIIDCYRKYISPVQESCEETRVVPSSSSTATSSNVPGTVSVLNKEDCNKLIKNDSLRVRLRGLDQVTIRNHMPQYNHFFRMEKEVSCESMTTSSMVQRSKLMTSSTGQVQYMTQKVEFKSETKKKKEPKLKKPLALEYKKGDRSTIGYNFTIHYRTITVNKNDGYTQVALKIPEGCKDIYITFQALKELRETLIAANADSECQVLIMNSTGVSFCLGLDLRPVLGEMRVDMAKKIAIAVKDFIEALAAFRKPLVVVVNGSAVGLGVTMLAYSDVILSSDSATYVMPYSKLGFCPEGGATLMLPFVVGSTVAMDMLLRGRELSAQEAYSYGLVTEVLTPDQIPDKLVERVRNLAESPNSIMQNTKSMLRTHLYQRLGIALESETAMLPEQWLTETCQAALRDIFAKVDS